MPSKFAVETLQLAFDKDERVGFFPGLISLRFARRSKATLAFTRFEKTCVFEIDGISTAEPKQFMKTVFKRTKDEVIPRAHHWGKMNQMSKVQIRQNYETELVKWQRPRSDFLAFEEL